MSILRRLILALALAAGIAPAFAQAPPPVPALPDVERRTSYSISASTCVCAVNMALYGDSTDYGNWMEVWVNGVQLTQSGNWTIASPTGSLSTIPRPITDAILTFAVPQTGTVQIVGARRPRRVSQFSENRGVAARDLNQAVTDLVAMLRENWDKTNDVTGRAVLAPPGETLKLLPALASRQNMGACFDSGGNLQPCVAASGSFVAGSGITFTGSNPTTLSVNSATSLTIPTGSTTARSLSNLFGDFLTVKDFGALGDGATNDTAAIQAMIDASCPGHLVGLTDHQLYPIIFPLGTYMVTSLNATNCNGFSIQGSGTPAGSNGGTLLRKIAGANVNAVLDMTGSITGYNLKNFGVQSSLSDGDTPYASIGILLASSATNPNNGNFDYLENVSAVGRFGQASIYMYGVCCSTSIAMGTQNAAPSSTNSYAWVYANSNALSVVSAFTAIATGAQGASDFACYRCEMHAFTGGATASAHALLLDGVRGFNYHDGILASASPAYTVATSGANTEVTFSATHFYTDLGANAPFAIGNTTGSVRNLIFINPDLTLGVGGGLTSLVGGFVSGYVFGGIININGVVSNYHFGGIGTAPTPTGACAGTANIAGSDIAGTVTEGASVAGCNVVFATTFDFNRFCTVTSQSPVTNFAYTVSASQITVTHNAANINFTYTCSGT